MRGSAGTTTSLTSGGFGSVSGRSRTASAASESDESDELDELELELDELESDLGPRGIRPRRSGPSLDSKCMEDVDIEYSQRLESTSC